MPNSFVTLWTIACPGPSVHGIIQERIVEWVAISFSKCCSWSRDWTYVSCIVRILYHPLGVTRETLHTHTHTHTHTRDFTSAHVQIHSYLLCVALNTNHTHQNIGTIFSHVWWGIWACAKLPPLSCSGPGPLQSASVSLSFLNVQTFSQLRANIWLQGSTVLMAKSLPSEILNTRRLHHQHLQCVGTFTSLSSGIFKRDHCWGRFVNALRKNVWLKIPMNSCLQLKWQNFSSFVALGKQRKTSSLVFSLNALSK